ncbi:S49 family peptidase [Rhodanobacter aciditrophus]|uniref:S49 family peptidase n=1 Tax=Rhodanobacter aciditrophus TaxID=1623218 RepID=A0ABW4B279_9GAMM
MAWTEDEDLKQEDTTTTPKVKEDRSKDASENEQLIGALKEVLLSQTTEKRRARRWKLFFRFVYLFVFIGLIGTYFYTADFDDVDVAPSVAVIPMQGAIGAGAEVDANDFVALLDDAYENSTTQAVLIEMNSPGGSPVHAGILHDAIMSYRAARPDVPVIVVVEDMAASGGYYIASAADQIVVDKASLVGSIGVVSGGFEASELIEKIGVKRRIFTAGENKAFLDPFSPMSDHAIESWQAVLDETHAQFIAAVKAGRGDRLTDDPEIFSGMVYTGAQAVNLGLADRFGYAQQLLSSEFRGLTPHYYSPYQEPWEKLAKEFGVQLSASFERVLTRWY